MRQLDAAESILARGVTAVYTSPKKTIASPLGSS